MSASPRSATSNVIFFSLLAIVVLAYLFLLRPLNYGNEGLGHPRAGGLMPAVQLDSVNTFADSIDQQDLKGKVVLINFWATWCGPCQQEFPHMVELQKKFREHADFQLLSISCPGGGETEEDLRESTAAYLKQRGVEMDVYLDSYGATYMALSQATGCNGGIPLTLLVDRKGVVRGIWEGYVPGMEERIDSATKTLLAEG